MRGHQFVSCKKKRVYSIPFSCGGECIGQRGRCINEPAGAGGLGSAHTIVVHPDLEVIHYK